MSNKKETKKKNNISKSANKVKKENNISEIKKIKDDKPSISIGKVEHIENKKINKKIEIKKENDNDLDNEFLELYKPKTTKGFRITKYFSVLVLILFILCTCYFSYTVYKTNMIPNRYLLLGLITIFVFILVISLIVFRKKKGKVLLIILDIILVLLMCSELYVIPKVNDLVSFLNNNLNIKYETNIYNVIVKSDSNYNSLSDISNKDVHYVSDNNNLLVSNINSNISNANLIEESDSYSALSEVSTNSDYILVVNSGTYESFSSFDEEYDTKVKVIGMIEIKTEVENTNNANTDITSKPFAIYISGIDTRSGKLPSRSLSDVNIIMAVNPNTKKILLVHIPRDYYVQVHGTTGLKDKLTHTGTIGGINLSMKTVEDLLEIEIPYYTRVNFNSVISLVDAIGGIDIYNDQNKTFTCLTNSSCKFRPGINYNVDGKCALAFARERHAYSTGDRHRGENQEQVISLIINKLTSSTTLLTNFDDILSAMNGTFETNLTSSEIESLVKMQLNDMNSWNIETYNLNGTGSMEYTYSYPKQKLYVMNPDYSTVSTAVQKMNEILDEN